MDLLADLAAIVGPSDVIAPAEAAPFLTDHRRMFCGEALAVVRPRGVDEVAEILRWSARTGTPIHSQGGNTSLSGGATPTTPAVVVLTTKMNRIREVSPGGMWLEAQAGVTVEEIQDTARSAGLGFSPDWGARGSATIGGAVATNAGGLNVLWAGPMRHHVLGLRAVMADGAVLDQRTALRKDVSGVDLKQLLIGSEGTLGIVTDVVVALGPPAGPPQLTMAALTNLECLTDVAMAAREWFGGDLTAVELMNGTGVSAVAERRGIPRPVAAPADWYLLIGVVDRDGPERLARFVAEQVSRDTLSDAAMAASAAQQRQLWAIRDGHSPSATTDRYDEAVKLDVAVPLDAVTELIRRATELAEHGTPIATTYAFGHVGDGNIHLYALPTGDADFSERRLQLTDALHQLVINLGGTLSAEHGVGQLLRSAVAANTDPVTLGIRAQLKQLFDPDGRLNPGIGPV